MPGWRWDGDADTPPAAPNPEFTRFLLQKRPRTKRFPTTPSVYSCPPRSNHRRRLPLAGLPALRRPGPAGALPNSGALSPQHDAVSAPPTPLLPSPLPPGRTPGSPVTEPPEGQPPSRARRPCEAEEAPALSRRRGARTCAARSGPAASLLRGAGAA